MDALASRGNIQLVHDTRRRFPGLLIQGDTFFSLVEELNEEAPNSSALQEAQSFLRMYEDMMREVGLELPYHRQ